MKINLVTEVGPYNTTYHVGEEQSLQFKNTYEGPFYLTPEERMAQKNDRYTGEVKERAKTKGELLEEMKRQGFQKKGTYNKEQLVRLAEQHNVPLTVRKRVKEIGWWNKGKGLLQILWVRGFIDENKLDEYSLKGLKDR